MIHDFSKWQQDFDIHKSVLGTNYKSMWGVGVGEVSENSHKLTGGVYYFRLPFFYALSRVLEKFSRVIPTYPFSISKKILRELSGAYMLFYSYTCSISLFKAFIFLCNSFSLTYLN